MGLNIKKSNGILVLRNGFWFWSPLNWRCLYFSRCNQPVYL